MEKTTPSQDQTPELEKSEKDDQPEISPPVSGQTNNQNLIVILLVLILVVVVGIGAYYFGVQKGIQPISREPAVVDLQDSANQTATGDSGNNADNSMSVDDSQSQTLTLYQDKFAEQLQFNYDPKIWTSSQQVADRSTTLTFTHVPSNDVLTFKYTLAWGMGGGHQTFKANELVQIDAAKKLYRLQNDSNGGKPSYRYGRDTFSQGSQTSTIVIFDTNPAAKQAEIEYCNKLKSGEEMYAIYDDKECNDIIAGVYQGFVQQPGFDWSFSMNSKVPYTQINPAWAGDEEYVKSEGLDNGKVLVIIGFEGTNVQAADEIVKQIQI